MSAARRFYICLARMRETLVWNKTITKKPSIPLEWCQAGKISTYIFKQYTVKRVGGDGGRLSIELLY